MSTNNFGGCASVNRTVGIFANSSSANRTVGIFVKQAFHVMSPKPLEIQSNSSWACGNAGRPLAQASTVLYGCRVK